jgi:hypothetical protein
MEYLINERVLFILQPTEKGSFMIRVAEDKKAPPLLELSIYFKKAILVKILEKTLPWSPGYIFDIQNILKQIIERLNKEIKDQGRI